jgi:hypothetical protein
LLAVVNSDECAGSIFLADRSSTGRPSGDRRLELVAQPVAADACEIWLDGVTRFDFDNSKPTGRGLYMT